MTATSAPLLPESAGATAKGSTARGTYAYVKDCLGSSGLDTVRARLDAATRARLDTVEATEEIPYPYLVALWEVIDEVLGGRYPQWAEDAGAFSIDSVGVQLYGGILRKASPSVFLTQSISLFRLYYHPGDITAVEEVAGRAVLRLLDFDPITRLFCRRQTGGLRRAVELAGGDSARVRHVRCSIEGDAFCEWQLEWHVPRG
ncbi:MAG: hypothetical protein IPP90_20330 [Gemmatimonadaceae bacterium]|nr:hypothetical protein [Gemmatimonadaceae bacterium]